MCSGSIVTNFTKKAGFLLLVRLWRILRVYERSAESSAVSVSEEIG